MPASSLASPDTSEPSPSLPFGLQVRSTRLRRAERAVSLTFAHPGTALFVMMTHMHKQRNRHLVNPSGKKVSSATKAKIEAAQAQASASGTETPTRVTRSRAAKEGL